MAHVEGEIIINRLVEEVFDFVADERNEPRYNSEMLRSELISDGPVGLGSQFRALMSMRGRPVEMTIEFSGYERPRLLASSTYLSTMEIEGVLTFDPVPVGTRMRWSWDLYPKGFLKLLTPVVAHMGQRQEQRIWASLKQLLEARKEPALPKWGLGMLRLAAGNYP